MFIGVGRKGERRGREGAGRGAGREGVGSRVGREGVGRRAGREGVGRRGCFFVAVLVTAFAFCGGAWALCPGCFALGSAWMSCSLAGHLGFHA